MEIEGVAAVVVVVECGGVDEAVAGGRSFFSEVCLDGKEKRERSGYVKVGV